MMKLLVALVVYGVILSGWFLNVYKLCQLDFEESYKAEIIRGIGVVTPISLVTGWMTFEEEEEK